jgi:hypothetical protein
MVPIFVVRRELCLLLIEILHFCISVEVDDLLNYINQYF